MYWSPADIADLVEAGLKARASADDREQAVYGFDSLNELRLHPLIHAALRESGLGVWPEQRYPGDQEHSRKSVGKRCDVVLTPDGIPLRDAEVSNTLFAASQGVDLDEAYWLEIKTVAQFIPGGEQARYSAELFSPVVADVTKIWSDPIIRHGGLLLVLFTLDRDVADHDIVAWRTRCLDRGIAVGAPAIRGFSINDRIGNAWCTVAVFGIKGA
jgi:hypothetical protein